MVGFVDMALDNSLDLLNMAALDCEAVDLRDSCELRHEFDKKVNGEWLLFLDEAGLRRHDNSRIRVPKLVLDRLLAVIGSRCLAR